MRTAHAGSYPRPFGFWLGPLINPPARTLTTINSRGNPMQDSIDEIYRLHEPGGILGDHQWCLGLQAFSVTGDGGGHLHVTK